VGLLAVFFNWILEPWIFLGKALVQDPEHCVHQIHDFAPTHAQEGQTGNEEHSERKKKKKKKKKIAELKFRLTSFTSQKKKIKKIIRTKLAEILIFIISFSRSNVYYFTFYKLKTM
jgi:hypothetical protein